MGLFQSKPAPLRPTPNIISADDLHDYVDVLDPLIQSLNRDMHENLVTGSPDELDGQAAVLEAAAKKWDDFNASYAGELRDRAAQKRALAEKYREKGLSADTIRKHKNLDDQWSLFYGRWTKHAAKVRDIDFLTTGGDWTALQGFDLEFQALRSRYKALGFKPSMELPPPPPSPSTIIFYVVGGVVIVAGVIYFGPVLAPAARGAWAILSGAARATGAAAARLAGRAA